MICTYTPQDADNSDSIQSLGTNAGQTRPNGEVDIIHSGQDAPKAIHLRVVAVDLGSDEEKVSKDCSKCKCRDQGVGGEVDSLQALQIPARLAQAGGEPLQLRQVGEHS